MEEVKEICPECGKDKYEYDKDSPCKKNHDWRRSWREDKTTKKYERYIKKFKKTKGASHRKRLDKLNKRPPKEFENREKKQGAYKQWKSEEV